MTSARPREALSSLWEVCTQDHRGFLHQNLMEQTSSDPATLEDPGNMRQETCFSVIVIRTLFADQIPLGFLKNRHQDRIKC